MIPQGFKGFLEKQQQQQQLQKQQIKGQ